MIPTILAVLICYLLGGIPFGLLIGRLNGVDIRKHGSGNIGATNVWRVCGRHWGLLCFLLDALKGFLPVLMVGMLIARGDLNMPPVAKALAVFATVAGHVWSPYLKLAGGKGVATSAGAVLALAPWPVVIAFAVWGLVLATSRYVSLASIVAAAVLPISALVLNAVTTRHYDSPTLAVLILLGLLAIVRHRSNIQRLLAGTENRLGAKKEATHEDSSSE